MLPLGYIALHSDEADENLGAQSGAGKFEMTVLFLIHDMILERLEQHCIDKKKQLCEIYFRFSWGL